MSTAATSPATPSLLLVGDVRRPLVGLATLGCLLVAAVFEVFAVGVKEIPALSDHAPWADDPYDVATSFAIFFVPLIAAVCLIRALLCRRAEPLPLTRAIDLLRGCQLIIVVVAVTLIGDWISAGLLANRDSWSAVTIGLIGGLATTSLATLAVAVVAGRASRALPPVNGADPTTTDLLGDAVLLGRQAARWLGPAEPVALRALNAVDRRVVSRIRRYPVGAAVIGASAFAGAIVASVSLEEGVGPALVLFFAVGWCAMFAFLVGGGSYLGVVRGPGRVDGARRRLLDAVVVTSASVPIALGFRDSLWPLVGSTGESAGLHEVGLLLTVVAALTFTLTLIAETAGGLHEPASAPR
ncbi:MAG TPA: hypothetical protein VIM30_17085 [Candidatus Limnocylindrales bacterium]|jgi:hypothetical protein